MPTSLTIYLIVINVVTFVLFGLDKWKAKNHKWRIPEATLLGFSIMGGSLGALLGMYGFHHKTKHKKFKWTIPEMLFVHIVVVLLMVQ